MWNLVQSDCPVVYKFFYVNIGQFFSLSFQGCSWSVIFVDIDAHNRNRQTLCSLLPRESRSHVRYFYNNMNRCLWLLCSFFLYPIKCSKVLEVGRRGKKRECCHSLLWPVEIVFRKWAELRRKLLCSFSFCRAVENYICIFSFWGSSNIIPKWIFFWSCLLYIRNVERYFS